MYKVKQGNETLFEGTIAECWDFLMTKYEKNTVKLLIDFKVRIE